jgi:hypothetical protein
MQKKSKILLIVILSFGVATAFLITPIVEYFQFGTRYGDGVIRANIVDVEEVAEISKFRSCAGHPYPRVDELSSEKHYITLFDYCFDDPTRTIKLFALWDGTIEDLIQDIDPAIGWSILLSSSWYMAVYMHVEYLDNITKGMKVKAGDWIGYADVPHPTLTYTSFDICIHRGRAYSDQTYSYFEMMPDSVFTEWSGRGLTDRTQVIISAAYRAANPCTIYNSNHAEDWLTLTV